METLQRAANAGSVSTGNYEIDNSCKFEPDNSESMSRTPAGNGNLKTCTISFWVKITELNKSHMFFTGDYGGASDPWFVIGIISDKIYISSTAGISGDSVVPSRLLRDTSAWYHLVFAFDTTQGTAADRIKIYVNGVQETVFTTTNYPSLNQDLDIMAAKAQGIAGYNDGTDYRFAGYMSEFVGIDGQALAPTEFGEFDADSGIWKPIAVSGLTFGTNGFYLDFADSANLGNDASGGLDFTETNIAAADQATDTPTNNFCTINALVGTDSTISEGATKFKNHGANGWESFVASMGAGTSGKWYAEFKFVDSDNDNMIGICPIDDPDLNRGFATTFPYYGSDTSLDESVGYYGSDGNRFIGGGPSSYGNSYARTNIVSIAVDMDNGKLYFAKDGVWQNSGDPTSGATGTGALDVRGATKPQSLGAGVYYANESTLANYGGFTTISISSAASDANGYGTFEYAPPTGYYALCTKNLAEYG